MAGNGKGVDDDMRSDDKEPDLTVCPVCSKKMVNPLICMNTLVLCPHCNEILSVSVSTESQQKFFSPLSSECPFPKYAPVCTLGQQYDLALDDPRYFHIILELVSIVKNKPIRVPVLFQGKELNLHRMFVEVTCRGGIFKVSLEGRLREVCTALAENLSDWDLYNMYLILLYDLETWLCCFPYEGHIPPDPPLRSFAGAHTMQRFIGQPSQLIQASSYTNAAPVNNIRLHTQMLAAMGVQPSSSNLIPAVANNILLCVTASPGFHSEYHTFSSLPRPTYQYRARLLPCPPLRFPIFVPIPAATTPRLLPMFEQREVQPLRLSRPTLGPGPSNPAPSDDQWNRHWY